MFIRNLLIEKIHRFLIDVIHFIRGMEIVIEAIYEKGILKPLEKLNLKEGERVKIKIERNLDEVLEEYCGLIESKITLEDIKKLRGEAKEWRKF